MAYVTYTTLALVCGTYDRQTSNRSYLLFTREAGMLFAAARSVREEKSRQRYALQDFSLVKVSLIKGKSGWRIGSIESRQNYYSEANDKAARGSVVSVFRLLRRFVKGEESAAELFDYTVSVLDQVSRQINERKFVQIATQVRIMSSLGYVDIKKIPEIIREVPPGELATKQSSEIEAVIDNLYTHAIKVSHL